MMKQIYYTNRTFRPRRSSSVVQLTKTFVCAVNVLHHLLKKVCLSEQKTMSCKYSEIIWES